MMSRSVLNTFMGLLYTTKLEDMIRLFYTEEALIFLDKNGVALEQNFGKDILTKTFSALQILQFKVEDLVFTEETSQYKIFSVTKNIENQIDFAEHTILNKWRNNKIYEHRHTIKTL